MNPQSELLNNNTSLENSTSSVPSKITSIESKLRNHSSYNAAKLHISKSKTIVPQETLTKANLSEHNKITKNKSTSPDQSHQTLGVESPRDTLTMPDAPEQILSR